MSKKEKKFGSTQDLDEEVNVQFSSAYISNRQYSIDEASFVPVDIYETKDTFIIEIEIPGANINDIKVLLVENDVVIEGTKHEMLETEGKVNFLCMERSFGPFRRTVRIEHAVDKININASYSDGLLFIRLPKKSERRERVRMISIEKGDKK